MAETFKVRVVKNIGNLSKEVFGEVGEIIVFKDGEFVDKQNELWFYNEFEELVEYVSNCDHNYKTIFEKMEEYTKDEKIPTFYAKVVENIGDMGLLDFGEVGTVIKIINGYYYDNEGDIWRFDTFDDLVKTTSYEDSFQTRFVLSTEEEYNKYWREEIKISSVTLAK